MNTRIVHTKCSLHAMRPTKHLYCFVSYRFVSVVERDLSSSLPPARALEPKQVNGVAKQETADPDYTKSLRSFLNVSSYRARQP